MNDITQRLLGKTDDTLNDGLAVFDAQLAAIDRLIAEVEIRRVQEANNEGANK